MKYPITIEALEVLDAIDRKGSFAAAANALYRVPSAITYTVQKLEQDLDVTLFRKEGRRSKLTPAGKVLLEQGREILEAAQRLATTTKQVDSGWEPSLNIAIDSVLDFEFIYPLIENFYSIQPDIEINLHEEVLAGAWESILSDRCDLVIGAPDTPAQGRGIESHALFNTEWVFAVAKHHPLARMALPLNRADVEQYRFVVARDSARNQPAISKRLFTMKPVLSVPTLHAKIHAQQRGMGVGFLPRNRIQHLLDSGELINLPISQVDETSSAYIGWKTAHKGKALRWFAKQVLLYFKNSGPY
ncbi:MAG TPA: LysR substrate-binding domain-containing protein [Pseudomonadales bacterium]